jgi:orotidine-5'-phosphate decarboxylase
VIGRPIVRATDPRRAAEQTVEEMIDGHRTIA